MYKNLEVGDFVIFRKQHPSKTTKWKLVRIGAKYKFQSYEIFDLFIELKREVLEKQIKHLEEGEK